MNGNRTGGQQDPRDSKQPGTAGSGVPNPGRRRSRLVLLLACWALLLLVDLFGTAGLLRLRFDDGLARTFESDTARHADFRALQEDFDAGTNRLFLLLEAESFAERARLQALADYLLDLQLTDGVAAAVSAFSLPVPGPDGPRAFLSGESTTWPDDLSAAFADARQRQPWLDRFLSADADAMLVVLQLEPEPSLAETSGARVPELELAKLRAAGIEPRLTGYPVIQQRVLDQLARDFRWLNLAGAVLGSLTAALVLRSLVFGAATAAVAATALLWVLGLLGLSGIPISVVTVPLPVLILVIAFSDALHLSHETRRLHAAGCASPVRSALRRVAPACVLASVSTAIAFASLSLSSSQLIAELGVIGASSTLIALVAVLVVHPLVMTTLLALLPARYLFGRAQPPRAASPADPVIATALRYPRRIALTALAAMCLAIAAFTSVEYRFSLLGSLPEQAPTLATLRQVEASFGPTGALLFRFDLDAEAPAAAFDAAHDRLAAHVDGQEILSPTALARRMGTETRAVLDSLPAQALAQMVSRDGTAGLVSLPYPYAGSEQTRRQVAEIETSLADDPAARAIGLSRATGLETMSAFASHDMLGDFNRCFLVAILASGALILAWSRSLRITAAALIPNALPVTLVGGWLALSGRGLDFASGIALTIAFGLAIDDTLHALNRLRLTSPRFDRARPDDIHRALSEVAPALIMTSVTLSIGLSATLFAGLPSVVAFGALSIAVFGLALLADLVVLPACLVWMSGTSKATHEV
ncbi:MMPL family transporter [Tropicimonas sp. TH_r6]|uniref:efflux RND transporter permease subunit n=1 Tax=Tropicimonas sp. TH_r6 TaxID=3082085 RepID=UPI002955856C|nr:MMPL family transporter [Tropicimonas sp. TH_r6]MDV7143789.1 MMPL family transporter [Tropicimonas sp. TH_r6]